eukprot:gene19455-biopygen6984
MRPTDYVPLILCSLHLFHCALLLRAALVPLHITAPGCSRLLPAAPGCSRLLPAAPACSRLLRAAPGCCRLLPAAPGCSGLLPAAPRGSACSTGSGKLRRLRVPAPPPYLTDFEPAESNKALFPGSGASFPEKQVERKVPKSSPLETGSGHMTLSGVCPEGRKDGPEGRKVCPEGRKVGPEGRKVCPEGREVCPEGRKGCPEGRKVCPEGRKVSPEGRKVRLEQG